MDGLLKFEDRFTELEERNIGYKNDIVLLTQENSQMFERITALEKELRDLQTASQAKIYNGPS